ncbi:MAG: hypothetical protein U0414_16445 [Polyangiaceae bacterium]
MRRSSDGAPPQGGRGASPVVAPTPLWRRRGLWLALAVVTYPALASAASRGWAPLYVGALTAAVFAIVVVFALTDDGEVSPSDGEAARAALRACATGLVAVGATLLAAPSPWTTALRNAGAGLTSIAAIIAIARVPALPSALEVPAAARSISAAYFLAFIWSIAVALPGFVAFSTDPDLVPSAGIALASVSATVASALTILLHAVRTLRLRRLELGVRDRLALPILLGGVAVVAGILAGALGLARSEWSALGALGATAAISSIAAAARAPDVIAAWTRFTAVVFAPTMLLALGAAFVATRYPAHAAAAAVAAVLLAALLGLAARRLSMRIGRDANRWLETLTDANTAALSPDPEPALDAALGALARRAQGSVRLFLAGPNEVLIAAWSGQVRRDASSFPAAVAEAAAREHLGVLRRVAALEAAVRNLGSRIASEWMQEREVEVAVRITEDDATSGLLAFAMPNRTDPLTIAEVVALRALADRLGAVVAVHAKLKRSWERERVTRKGSEEIASNLATAEAERHRAGRASDDLVERLARPALTASYSSAARSVRAELDAWAERPGPHTFTLIGALGVQGVPWAAAFHRSEARPGRPFVVVESGSHHPGAPDGVNDLDFWRDPDLSPLARARGGTLVLHDPQLLHKLVQSYISIAIPDDTNVVLVATSALDVLVAREELEPRFAARIGDLVLVLPTLAERPEDLRALVVGQLAELGARFRGAPLAIDPDALGLLVNHLWPGNEAELVGVLTAAAARSADGRIRTADLKLDRGASSRDEEPSYRATSGLGRPPRTRRAR